jgi:hypothetical protein
LPPETVIDTATVPYWCVTVPPANVPSFIPPAGAAVVAFAVVPAAFVVAAVVPALAAAVPAFDAAADEAAALAAADDDWAATAADCSAVVGNALASVAAPDGPSLVDVVGSAATASGAPVSV